MVGDLVSTELEVEELSTSVNTTLVVMVVVGAGGGSSSSTLLLPGLSGSGEEGAESVSTFRTVVEETFFSLPDALCFLNLLPIVTGLDYWTETAEWKAENLDIIVWDFYFQFKM